MRLNITEGEMYYTNELDAIQDTIKKNFPNFDVHIARGKYPFVSVRVTKNANKNIHHRLSDLFTIRQEDDGRITCTCPTYDDAEFFDLIGIVNYFDDYLNNPNTENNRGYFESVKRNRRMTEEIVDTSDDEDIDDDNYTNEEKDAIIAEKRLRHYLLGDNYYAWDAFAFNRIIDALLDLDKKHREFYRSGKKKNRASERRLHQLSMYVDALIQDADREAGNPVIAIDYSEIFDKFPELEQDAKRIGLKTK